MENLRYGAPNREHSEKLYAKQRFFPYRLLILLLGVLIGVLILLFPGSGLEKTLLHQSYFSLVDYRYSLLLLEKRAKFSIRYQEIEKNPLQVIRQLNDARPVFFQNQAWENLWLSYIIIKTITYDEKKSPAVKRAGLSVMKDYFRTFQRTPNTLVQLNVLAQDALSCSAPVEALSFYEAIIQKKPHQTVRFYTQAVKIALWAQDLKKAEIYVKKLLEIQNKR